MLDAMKVKTCSESLNASHVLLEPMPLTEKHFKLQRAIANYKFEHQTLYQENGLTWPPSMEDLEKSCDSRNVLALAQRKIELLRFVVKVFLMPADTTYHFIDIHPSLTRQVGLAGDQDPWRNEVLGTIIGSSEMAMRRRFEGTIEIRVLSGKELMQFAGWDHTFYHNGDPAVADSELAAMSGNCFNAFSLAPLFASVLSQVGYESEALVEDPAAADFEVEGDSSDSSETD